MSKKLLSIKEVVEPIIGGYWGETVEAGAGNARVVRNGDVLESGEVGKRVPERKLTEKEIKKAQLQLGDVLITMSGNVGRVALVRSGKDSEGKPYVASNFVKILRAKTVMPEYIFFFLRDPRFQSEIRKYTRGVAIQNLSVKVFDQEFIPNLPEKEQRQIVALLEEAEELKRKRSEADQKMTAVIPALFNQMFGGTDFQKEKVMNVIAGDRAIRTGPFGSQLHHHEFTSEGIPVLGIDNVVSNTFRWAQPRHLPVEKYEKFKRFRVYPGDVLVTIMGTVGRACLAPEDLPECMSTKHLCVITPDVSKVNATYLWASLLYDHKVRHQTRNVAKGAIMEGWNSTIIKNLSISLPPIKLQNEFADKVKSIQTLTPKQKESAMKIEELFSSLLAGAFVIK